MRYKYDIVMYSHDTDRFCKWVQAYQSEKVANKVCERLNAEETKDPYYGKVYYEVVAR